MVKYAWQAITPATRRQPNGLAFFVAHERVIVTNENSSEEISTGGGAAVSGNVETGGGGFVGRDINTITINKPPRKPRGGTDLHSQISQVQDELFEFGSRLVEIEKVLGGQWGMPGVVAKVDTIHEKLNAIDERLASRERAWLAIIGLLSTLNLALFAILYVFWRL